MRCNHTTLSHIPTATAEHVIRSAHLRSWLCPCGLWRPQGAPWPTVGLDPEGTVRRGAAGASFAMGWRRRAGRTGTRPLLSGGSRLPAEVRGLLIPARDHRSQLLGDLRAVLRRAFSNCAAKWLRIARRERSRSPWRPPGINRPPFPHFQRMARMLFVEAEWIRATFALVRAASLTSNDVNGEKN